MIDKIPEDLGMITVLLKCFKNQRLPRLLTLKVKVDNGEPLDNLDIKFMKEVFTSFEQVKPLLKRHPEYEPLVTDAIQLYKDITDAALDNQ